MIDDAGKSKLMMFGAWSGLYYVAGLVIGWWIIAGFIPPSMPSSNPEEIAALFYENMTRIRIGMVISMYGATMVIPFGAVVAQYLSRLEGRSGILTYSMILGCGGTLFLTFCPPAWWLVAAFRAERTPELIQIFNDMAWLIFVGGIAPFFVMPLTLAAAAFLDMGETPVFPRWSGFFNIWVVLLMLPDQLIFFFHEGPFAWNGVFGIYVPMVAYFGWFSVTTYLIRAAVLRDRARLAR